MGSILGCYEEFEWEVVMINLRLLRFGRNSTGDHSITWKLSQHQASWTLVNPKIAGIYGCSSPYILPKIWKTIGAPKWSLSDGVTSSMFKVSEKLGSFFAIENHPTKPEAAKTDISLWTIKDWPCFQAKGFDMFWLSSIVLFLVLPCWLEFPVCSGYLQINLPCSVGSTYGGVGQIPVVYGSILILGVQSMFFLFNLQLNPWSFLMHWHMFLAWYAIHQIRKPHIPSGKLT